MAKKGQKKSQKKSKGGAAATAAADNRDDDGNDSAPTSPTSPIADANGDVQPTPLAASPPAATSAVSIGSNPPPPPSPPPPPALPPTPPTFKGAPRVVRRQSTSGPPTRSTPSAHARSATDPSSSTPNLPLPDSGTSAPPTPPIHSLIAQAVLKRSNTLDTFLPSAVKKLERDGADVDNRQIRGQANGNENASTSTSTSTNNGSSTLGRRTSFPPPPIKPKPSSLQSQKKVTHERSTSTLLRTAVVQNASAAAGINPTDKPGPGSTTTKRNEVLLREETPERRNSVQQLARSLESTLHFSAPPSPGTPPALPKRSSIVSNRSVKSVRSVKDGSLASEKDAEGEDNKDGENKDGDGERVQEGHERMSANLPSDFKAVIASLAEKGIKTETSGFLKKSTTSLSKGSVPAPVSTSSAPLPSTPSLSPPTSGTTETFTAPTSPALIPPATPPPPPPSKESKPKLKSKGERDEGVEELVSPHATTSSAPPADLALEAPPLESVAGTADSGPTEEPESPPASASVTAPEPVSVPSAPPKRYSVPHPPRYPPLPPTEEEIDDGDDTETSVDPNTDTTPNGEKRAPSIDEEEVAHTLKDVESVNIGLEVPGESPSLPPAPPPPASPPPPVLPTKSSKRYSTPPPPRPPPPIPIEVNEDIPEGPERPNGPKERRVDVDEGEKDATSIRKFSRPQRPVPDLPPPTPVDGQDESGEDALLGGIVVQEPEEINELDMIADDQGQVRLRLEAADEYDSADDSSDDERYESYRTALSRSGSDSAPPTPPTKRGSSFPANLTSKWSRNTSAVQSNNASVTTLTLDQDHTRVNTQKNAEIYSDEEDASLEDTTLAHMDIHDIGGGGGGGGVNDGININIHSGEINPEQHMEDPMESRFKFPPVSSFPPPPPLPHKRNTNTNAANRKAMAFANESDTSLASTAAVKEDESADDADRESTAPRNKKKSKTKSTLRTALVAALGKSASTPPAGIAASAVAGTTATVAAVEGQDSSPTNSQGELETETTGTRSSGEGESNPVTRQMRARLAKLDGHEPPTRPMPFPTGGDGEHGQSQSAPEVPVVRRPGVGTGLPEDETRKRQVRLSSKLLPITGPTRMNTSPSTVTAWGKSKSSETVGTIGTIATEPGDLDQSQFGFTSASGSRAQSPPPSSFLHRMMSDASRRPLVRRQTTSTSHASRFVEDLAFLKRTASPTSMEPSQSAPQQQQASPTHQRSATVSFSSHARAGSMGTVMGPPTRKNSIMPELRAATIEAAERPLSAVSGDFVLVEEPEEFDIPRAEWDLPRIPSGSLRLPSTMDLRAKMMQQSSRLNIVENASGDVNGDGRERSGPSSAPAGTSQGVPVTIAPIMQHSRSATTATSNSTNTAKSSVSAPAATWTGSSGGGRPNAISFQVSSGSDGAATSPGGGGATSSGRLSSNALLDLWGRVGVYMSDAAALLHDKSRRVLVGDGTYPGFVLAVSRQVPTSCIPSKSARYPYGHLIYFQTAQTVHKRYAEILPGDVLVLQNALFKGVRGPLHQSYQEELGTKGDPVVGVIGEFEARKTKVRVYQANQHVGIQTVEYVSYRFEDLKSGTIKIFRVPDS